MADNKDKGVIVLTNSQGQKFEVVYNGHIEIVERRTYRPGECQPRYRFNFERDAPRTPEGKGE